MARIEDIERRLNNWARWKLGLSSGGLGYGSSSSLLEPGGSGYREAVIPTVDCEAEETDRAIQSLNDTLRATLEVVYVGSGSRHRKAEAMGISESTIESRVWQAHRLISAWLVEQRRQADDERRRVEQLARRG